MGAPSPEVPAFAGTTFERALDLLAPDGRIGLAVSGGPDSLALLLLAARAQSERVEAATVDHGLRAESAREAAEVAAICKDLGVPHTILQVEVGAGASLQARARAARYSALGGWARDRQLRTVATGHHLDDQAETLLMRLARGSGLRGLAAMRPSRPLTEGVRLIRPLLGLRKAELVAVVEAAGLIAVDDPANRDERHDRTRVRGLLETVGWLGAERLARSAEALGQAEEALRWSTLQLAGSRLRVQGGSVEIEAADLPLELKRRLLNLGFERLGAACPIGPDMDRALATLSAGGTCTLSGVKLSGGTLWRLTPAPPRRGQLAESKPVVSPATSQLRKPS
jgi:tRNA(Ile)-lysidine synthase